MNEKLKVVELVEGARAKDPGLRIQELEAKEILELLDLIPEEVAKVYCLAIQKDVDRALQFHDIFSFKNTERLVVRELAAFRPSWLSDLKMVATALSDADPVSKIPYLCMGTFGRAEDSCNLQ